MLSDMGGEMNPSYCLRKNRAAYIAGVFPVNDGKVDVPRREKRQYTYDHTGTNRCPGHDGQPCGREIYKGAKLCRNCNATIQAQKRKVEIQARNDEIRRQRDAGVPRETIADQFGLTKNHVDKICREEG